MRTIEIDFSLTSDDKLVCWHDWARPVSSAYKGGRKLSSEEFMNAKIHDQYTPLSLESLLDLLKQYTDVYIVTDTKETEWEGVQKQFRILLETAEATDSMDVLDRFVVQLYTYEMYDAVEEIYPFHNYLLTLYMIGGASPEGFVSHCRFCRDRGIDTITMWDSWVTPELIEIAERYDIDIYVHTVNNVDDIEKLQGMGVKGFYTDYVAPEMLE